MGEILTALLPGLLSFLGVVLSSRSTAQGLHYQLEKAQAVTDTKLEELAREVREHNGFARRMPVVEEQLRSLIKRMEKLEEEQK